VRKWFGKIYETDNGRWRIEVYRTLIPGYIRGWLTNIKSGSRFVFSVTPWGRVSYMREYKTPNGIPKYMDEFLTNLREDLLG